MYPIYIDTNIDIYMKIEIDQNASNNSIGMLKYLIYSRIVKVFQLH